MPAEILKRYAVGGATRPDSFTGLRPEFQSALANLFTNAPPEVQNSLRVSSGYRSPGRQADLWEAALAKYGSPEAARKWVAPPGKSQHNHGQAVDLKYLSPDAQKWAHANAAQYGLTFPLSNENWHVELAGARDGKVLPAAAGGPAIGPAAPGGSAVPSLVGQPAPTQLGDAVANMPGILMAQEILAQSAAAPFQNLVKRQEEEAKATQERRKALFAGGLPGLYG
jgi:hypothetical protein